MIKRLIFLLTVCVSFVNVNAQIFGGNPASIKWNQINTDTARIIFPKGLHTAAQRVANVVHELQRSHNATIGTAVRKINIVLQNQSTLSNAYVGLGPYRSEFNLIAPQSSFDLGALNWVDNLALHEYRHVQQFNNFNVGLSKVAGVLFGQEGQALANSAAVPDWFFEGDAVFTETVFSEQGRGRIPDFFKGYQSLMRYDRDYLYMKLRNGSFKDFVPNHYELGYLLVGYGREKYGAEFWRKVTQDAARFRPLFYPFQGAVKKYTGTRYKQFVKDALDYYHRQWQQVKQPSFNYISAKTKYRSDYRYPYFATDGSYIVLKSSFRKIPSFYRITSAGNEQKIATRGIGYDDYFSYNNGKIIYSSLKPHVRWGYKEYSDIKLLDVQTGEERTVTRGERYFAPDISHDGTMIVAVDMRSNQSSDLVQMDVHGKRMFTEPGGNFVYTHPKFSADDKYIYTAVRNTNGQMALQKIQVGSQKQAAVNVLPFRNRIIGFPTVQGDTIFFSSSYKGSDEIWAYVESKNTTYRVATNPTGFYQATFDKSNGQLIASAFTADGYRLAGVPSASLLWQKIDEGEDALPDLYIPKALNQENNSTLQNIPSRRFSIAGYRKSFNLLNFHSWRPYYDHPEFSFTVFGQNILNTFQTELSYTYNRNEGSNRVGASAIYGGWFIQPSIGANHTWNRTAVLNQDTTFLYNESNANVGLTLPLNFSGGKSYRWLTLNTSLNTQEVRLPDVAKTFFRENDFNYLQGQISYTSQIQKALQQIYPHWAQSINVRYRSIINELTANQFLATGNVFLPGLHTNHSIVLNGSYHARDTLNQYIFSNSFPFSRGYRSIDFPRMWKFGGNYHFPLFYPDWGVANIVYFQRLRANAFYDYTVGKSLRTGTKTTFSTVGGELYFDTKWWNQQSVSLGVRYSRLLDLEFRGTTNRNHWEVILPVDLF